MTIQWTLVAGFLYSEIVLVLLLLVPFISPITWQRIFKSRICQTISERANLYFTIFIIILILFFLDSIREMNKYSLGRKAESEHRHLDAEIQNSMKLFRSQRNFYIAGFALFLWLVVRRLITLISAQANLLIECDAIMKQAQSATETAQKLMKEKEKKEKIAGETAENEGNSQREAYEAEINNLKHQLEHTQQELDSTNSNILSIQRQAESVSKDYSHLLEEHSKLQNELHIASGRKKDN